MRKTNQEIRDKLIIEEVLAQSTICRIAMIDKGEPYLLPFNYGYKDKCIYIHSASSGRKIDVLRAHPRVCFEVEQKADLIKGPRACDWSTLYRSVIGYGEIEIITEFDQKREGLEIIMTQHGASGLTDFKVKNVESVVILKLTIDSLSGKQSNNWNSIQEESCLELETDRLQLQEISWDDLDQLHKFHSIPEVDEYNTLGIPTSVDETKKIMGREIEAQMNVERSSYTWKIELKEGEHFIGLAGITLSNDKFRLGEIYYKLDPQFWGKGYATEVAKKLISTGFDELNLHKVEAGVAVGNERSIRVLEKAGMKREGLRRKILPIRGEWVDNYHYAIVENDLP
jgi:RimJ/RimL family protein N-acetyltransferase/nitroimidazol reductase NimA-like FMN-containing flavoprotein (pyridoxamine 5'-phosphate oxidase superfamily)